MTTPVAYVIACDVTHVTSQPKRNETRLDTQDRTETLHLNNAEANATTRKKIEAALIALMNEKDFADITITDITKEAGVSRLAYYRNYDSKEDILSGYLQNVTAEFYNAFRVYDAIRETRELWYAIFGKVKEHAEELHLLIRAGFSAKILQEYVKGINAPFGDIENNPELYYSNCYWVGALHCMTQEWLMRGMKEPIDQMVEIGVSMMNEGIATVETYGNRAEELPR